MMRNLKSFMMLAAIAAASFSFTSCDDDDYYYRDPYGWYGDYNHGDWGWNDRDWNQGGQGSQDNQLLAEAQTLAGDWYGKVQLSELADDGNSRSNYEFEANMLFVQDNVNSTSGTGTEIDYATDGSDATSTLKFKWYIDRNGDIYIKYTSGATYVMDLNASQYGFHLGAEDGHQNDTFYGYMIGTGNVKGDLMYIDLERNTSSSARVKSRGADSTSVVSSQAFGSTKSRKSIAGATSKGLPARR